MDKTELAQVTSKDESELEAAPQETRPSFLGRTHG